MANAKIVATLGPANAQAMMERGIRMVALGADMLHVRQGAAAELARHKLGTEASVYLGAAAIRLRDRDLSSVASPHARPCG